MYPRIQYYEDLANFQNSIGLKLMSDDVNKCEDLKILNYAYNTITASYWNIIRAVHKVKENEAPPLISIRSPEFNPLQYPVVFPELAKLIDILLHRINVVTTANTLISC